MVWQIFGILLLGALLYLGYLIYLEVRNQHHYWHGPCMTPEEDCTDIRHVLDVIGQVLEGKGITWWLDYGTLLGAWRVGDMMAYDHDLDVSFLAEHSALLAGCRDELAAQGVDLNMERTSLFYGGRKIGDMEPWYRFGDMLCRDDPAERKGLMKIHRANVDDFPTSWLTPTAMIRFNGGFYPCPNDTEALLRKRYMACRIHLRLTIPHKVKCWVNRDYWREAARIWRFRDAPEIIGRRTGPTT